MGNNFSVLNTALRGLQAQKKSMDTVGHNISNANTEGYSRQRAELKTTEPYTAPGMTKPSGAGQVGTGVKVDEINRIRDRFVDGQIWDKKQEQGHWDKRYEGLNRIEKIFNEPSEENLSANLSKFWEALEDLSNDPADSAIRTTVREQGQTLVDTINSLYDQLDDYKRSLNDDVATNVDEINSLTDRIADLNERIVHIKGSGQNPNDLMDERDKLFEELNELVNVRGREDKRGNLNISLSGTGLVNGDSANELKVEEGDIDHEDKVVFKETGDEAEISGGKLSGLMDIRDEELSAEKDSEGYIAQLNKMAETLKEEFNAVHREGYDLNGEDGEDFFHVHSGSDNPAAHIELAEGIKEDTNKIAAGRLEGDYSLDSDIMTAVVTDRDEVKKGEEYTVDVDDSNNEYKITDSDDDVVAKDDFDGTSDDPETKTVDGVEFTIKDFGTTTADMTPAPDNGENALELADVIKNDKIFNDGKSTMDDHYESMISTVGVDGRRADQMVDNTESVLKQLENQRESTSGVSLDEEMSNMIKNQQAYNASAKVISNTDEMLDSLMSIIR